MPCCCQSLNQCGACLSADFSDNFSGCELPGYVVTQEGLIGYTCYDPQYPIPDQFWIQRCFGDVRIEKWGSGLCSSSGDFFLISPCQSMPSVFDAYFSEEEKSALDPVQIASLYSDGCTCLLVRTFRQIEEDRRRFVQSEPYVVGDQGTCYSVQCQYAYHKAISWRLGLYFFNASQTQWRQWSSHVFSQTEFGCIPESFSGDYPDFPPRPSWVEFCNEQQSLPITPPEPPDLPATISASYCAEFP